MITLKLLLAVIMVESGGNLNAINHQEQAYGCLQIRQVALADINRAKGTSYKLEDFLGNRQLSVWAFMEYGTMYGARSPEEFCRIWNGGPKGMQKPTTLKYWNKIKKQL